LLAVPSPYWIVRLWGVGVTLTARLTVRGITPAVGEALQVREIGPAATGVGVVVSSPHPARQRQNPAAIDRRARRWPKERIIPPRERRPKRGVEAA
jgi:hypothetical protein